MPSIGITPPKRTVRPSTSITPVAPRAAFRRPKLGRARAELRRGPSAPARRCPPGAVSSTWSTPTPNRIVRSSVDTPQSSSSARQQPQEERRRRSRPRCCRSPPMRTTARRMIEFWTGNWLMLTPPAAAASSAAGDAGHERRQRERPELVERRVHAGGHRGGLALADRGPGPARPCRGRARAATRNMRAATTTQ